MSERWMKKQTNKYGIQNDQIKNSGVKCIWHSFKLFYFFLDMIDWFWLALTYKEEMQFPGQS